MSAPLSEPPPSAAGGWRSGCIALGGVAAGLLLHGYRFGVVDQDIYLPLIDGAGGGGGFHPNDFLFGADVSGYSLFWWIVQRVSAVVSPRTLFLLLYPACQFVFLLSFGRVGRALGLSSAALALATLFASGPLPVGGLYPDPAAASIQTWDPYVTHRTLATALVWLSLARMVDGRWTSALAVAGIVFAVHPISAAPLLAAIAGAAVRERIHRSRAGRIGLLLLPVAAFPFVLLRLSRPSGGSPTAPVDLEWLAVARLRNPYAFLRGWNPLSFAVLGLFAAAAWASPRPTATGGEDARRRLAAALSALGISLLASVVFTDLVPIAGAIQFQLLRGLAIPLLLALAPISRSLAAALGSSAASRACAAWTAASLVQFDERLFASGLLAGSLAARDSLAPPRARAWALRATAVGALLIATRVDAGARPFSKTGLLLGAASAAAAAVAPAILRGRRARLIGSVAAAAALVAGAGLGPLAIRGGWRERFDLPGAPPRDGWEEAQAWARAQPGRPLFVVPPSRSGWRTGSGKSALVTFKDGGAALLDRAFALEWRDRMRAVGGLGPERRWDSLSSADFDALRATYGATHAVVEAGRSLPFAVVYGNREFVIVRLDAPR